MTLHYEELRNKRSEGTAITTVLSFRVSSLRRIVFATRGAHSRGYATFRWKKRRLAARRRCLAISCHLFCNRNNGRA